MTIGFLRKCSISYLLLPSLLFSAGWFRQPYAIILIVGYLYLLIRELLQQETGEKLSVKDIFFLLFFAVSWTFFCGVDALSTQTVDWLAHNVKFYDLYKHSWPNYFPEVERTACYYFGYYLVPSAIFKLTGQFIPLVITIWTAVGFFLGISWIYMLIDRNKFLILLFPFMRGLGQILSFILAKLHILKIHIPIITPSIRSIFQQSSFVPNQIIPALIVCGILLYDFINGKRMDKSFFLITIIFIWSVFPAIAILMVFGALFVHKYFVRNNIKSLFDTHFLHDYLVPGLLFIPVFIYFLSSDGSVYNDFLWNFRPFDGMVLGYVSGVFLDFLLLYTLVFQLNKKIEAFPLWLINVLFISLFLLSIYRMGEFNDLFFRGSVPLCIIIFTVILRENGLLWKSKVWPKSVVFYFSAILISSLTVLQIAIEFPLVRDNVLTNYYLGARRNYIKYDYQSYENSYQALVEGYKDQPGANEYLSSENSFYELYLRKDPDIKLKRK